MSTLNALVLENDRATFRSLRKALEKSHITPVRAADTEHLVDLIDSSKVDGVFLDWDNCWRQSHNTPWWVRRSRSNAAVPIIGLTETNETESIAQAWRCGVNYFLSKPLEAEQTQRVLGLCLGAMQQERRRYQRVPLSVPVFCVLPTEQRLHGHSINISTHGMLLALWPPPEPGAQLTLAFGLDEPQEFMVRGTVVRADPEGHVAIQYAWHSTERAAQLQASLAERMKRLS